MLFKKLVLLFIGFFALCAQAQTVADLTKVSLEACQQHETERYMLFGPNELVARDITKTADLNSVDWFDGPIRDACKTVQSFMVAHCHQDDNILSGFPSSTPSLEDGGDYTHAFELTMTCAFWAQEAGREPPEIHFALIDVPEERLVFYGLTEAWRDRAIELAKADLSMARAIDNFASATMPNIPLTMKNVGAAIREHRQQVADAYTQSVADYNDSFDSFLREHCAVVEGALNCDDEFSVEVFAEQSYQQGKSFVLEPLNEDGVPSASLIRIGEGEMEVKSEFNADLSSYPHVTRVMDVNHYEELVQAPVAIMLHCGLEGMDEEACEYMLRDTKALMNQCSTDSVVGFIDVTAMPELMSVNRFAGERFDPVIKVYSEGQRTLLKFSSAMSLTSMGKIICSS